MCCYAPNLRVDQPKVEHRGSQEQREQQQLRQSVHQPSVAPGSYQNCVQQISIVAAERRVKPASVLVDQLVQSTSRTSTTESCSANFICCRSSDNLQRNLVSAASAGRTNGWDFAEPLKHERRPNSLAHVLARGRIGYCKIELTLAKLCVSRVECRHCLL